MSAFLGTIIGNLVITFGIITTIFFVKKLKNKLLNYINYIVSITVGLLLGIIFIGFFPELVESGISGEILGLYVLVGLFVFYIFELFLHWHHCQDLGHENHDCQHKNLHNEKNGLLIFGSTFLHNAFHGVILFGAFGVNISFGIATTFAILLHSIPQNIVNYIMNHKVDKYSYIAAFAGVFGALITFPFAEKLLESKFNILAVITGGLLYTALADIFPEFKEKGELKSKFLYLIFILLGVILFFLFNTLV